MKKQTKKPYYRCLDDKHSHSDCPFVKSVCYKYGKNCHISKAFRSTNLISDQQPKVYELYTITNTMSTVMTVNNSATCPPASQPAISRVRDASGGVDRTRDPSICTLFLTVCHPPYIPSVRAYHLIEPVSDIRSTQSLSHACLTLEPG